MPWRKPKPGDRPRSPGTAPKEHGGPKGPEPTRYGDLGEEGPDLRLLSGASSPKAHKRPTASAVAPSARICARLVSAIDFASLRPVTCLIKAWWMVTRFGQAQQSLQQAVDGGCRTQVFAAHHVGHALGGVIDDDREMIAGANLLACNDDIAPDTGLSLDNAVFLCQVSGPARAAALAMSSRSAESAVKNWAILRHVPGIDGLAFRIAQTFRMGRQSLAAAGADIKQSMSIRRAMASR